MKGKIRGKDKMKKGGKRKIKGKKSKKKGK